MSGERLEQEDTGFTWESVDALCEQVDESNLAAKALLAEVDKLLGVDEPELAEVVSIRAA